MKTTLLSLLLLTAISLPLSAQEEKKDAPRGDGDKREAAQRDLAKAKENIEHHMQAARAEVEALEKAGKKDEAEARRRQAEEQFKAARNELEQHTRAAQGSHEGGDRPDARRPEGAPPRAELENKLHHVEQAITHLQEAGLAEPAENLKQLANHLRAALKGEGDGPRREEPRRPDGDRREGEPRRPDGPPPNDIEALRREIQELRQAVRQLSEKQPH